MKDVEYFRWYLPNPNPRCKPYLTRWHMTAEQAAERGALRAEPTSREIRRVAENAVDVEQLRRDADTSAVQRPRG